MVRKPSLREQQTQETRSALLNAGRNLFGRNGFNQTSAQDIVARARVTRGALYHHFKAGKPGLFNAVARQLQKELLSVMVAAARSADGSWNAMRASIQAYFDFADNAAYQQICLQDAPAVLGAEQWRLMEHEYSLQFIERGVAGMISQGEIRALSTGMLASTIFGACCEATLTIAAAKDSGRAKKEAVHVIMAMIEGLRPVDK